MADLFDDIDTVASAPASIQQPPATEHAISSEENPEHAAEDHADSSAPPPSSEFVVKCRGLPWQVLQEDAEVFFADCDLLPQSLLFTFNQRGEGFAMFSTLEGHRKALAKNRQSMGSRYIEIDISSMAEYHRAREGGFSSSF